MSVFATVAQHFGLQIHSDLFSTGSGTVAGIPVTLANRSQGSEHGFVIEAYAREGADVDLGCRLQGGLLDGAGACGVEDSAFNGIWHTECGAGEESTARRLLSPAVRGELMTIARLGTGTLFDDSVRCVVERNAEAPEVISAMRACVDAMRALDEAAADADAPAYLLARGFGDAAREAATERSLRLAMHPLRAEGALGEDAVALRFRSHFRTRRRHYALAPELRSPGYWLALRFREPLGAGLAARPANWVDRAQSAVGLKDLQVGDAAFDRAWRIEARDEARALALLNPEARAVLTDLVALGGAPTLNDELLVYQSKLPESPSTVARVLSRVASLRAALRARAAESPYR